MACSVTRFDSSTATVQRVAIKELAAPPVGVSGSLTSRVSRIVAHETDCTAKSLDSAKITPTLRDHSSIRRILNHAPALVLRNARGLLSKYSEAVGGINYLSRIPQDATRGVNKALQTYRHATVATEALGMASAVNYAGGIVETGLAVKQALSTVKRIGKSTSTKAEFVAAQVELNTAYRQFRSAEHRDDYELRYSSCAQHAWRTRATMSKLTAALIKTPEHLLDGVRYTIVSWTSRVFSGVGIALKNAHWLSLATNILGVIGSSLQTATGMFKWHSSAKAVAQAKLMLHAAKSCKLSEAHCVGETDLQRCLFDHMQFKRQLELKKARSKRTMARIETAAGIAATSFGIGAFFCPPLAYVSIAIVLAYSCYRIYKGIQIFLATRKERRLEKAMRATLHQPQFGFTNTAADFGDRQLLTEKNTLFAVYSAVEYIQQDKTEWLRDLLTKIGIPLEDQEALFIVARAGNTELAVNTLEKMLYGNDWAHEISIAGNVGSAS